MPKEIGIDELGDFLSKTAGVTEHPQSKQVMQGIIDLTKKDLAKGFQTSTAPDGTKWPALKRPRPKRHNQNNKPLIDTKRLMNTVTQTADDHVEEASDEALTLGTYVEYSEVHQFGSRKKNIPARPFMGFSPKVKYKATEKVADDIIQQIDKL